MSSNRQKGEIAKMPYIHIITNYVKSAGITQKIRVILNNASNKSC